MERELIGAKNGFKVYLAHDDDPQDPRDDDNVGKMVCWHRRYKLGDEQPRIKHHEYFRRLAADAVNADNVLDEDIVSDEHVQRILETHFVILPLYLYDHSGITMQTAPFSCPWDSGQVGFIYVSMKKAREEWPNPDDAKVRESARNYLVGEVETYDHFLTGDVYGYIVEGPDEEEEDSCWGFFGYKYAKEEALLVLDACAKKRR